MNWDARWIAGGVRDASWIALLAGCTRHLTERPTDDDGHTQAGSLEFLTLSTCPESEGGKRGRGLSREDFVQEYLYAESDY